MTELTTQGSAWRRWLAARAWFEGAYATTPSWGMRRWVAARLRFDTLGRAYLPASDAEELAGWMAADQHGGGAPTTPATPPAVQAQAPAWQQRALRGLVTVLGMAVAVSVLVALVVPEVRGTVLGLGTLAVAGTVAVALARRWHGLAWARRAWHYQQRASRARQARAERATRQQANRATHKERHEARDRAAREAREQRRQARSSAWWTRQGRGDQ